MNFESLEIHKSRILDLLLVQAWRSGEKEPAVYQ